MTPNGHFSGRTAPLTSRCCIFFIYSTNVHTEYFKHAVFHSVFPLQNAVYFIMLPWFLYYSHFIYRVCSNLKENSGAKGLMRTESLRAYIPVIIICGEHATELREEITYFSVCVSVFEFACKNSRTAKRVFGKICNEILTDRIWYDIFVNCNWVVTRWQQYSTHLHGNNT